jgi:hypothetical protein
VRDRVIGKYLGSLLITACAGIATPAAAEPVIDEAPGATAAVAVQQVRVHSAVLRDEAAMVLVGTALIGLAAAVRRRAA